MMILSKGRRGPDVENWQKFLIQHGFLRGKADGVFGDETDAATRTFQGQRGLKVDGRVGPITLASAQDSGFAASRRVRNDEITSDLTAHAKTILRDHWRDPFGSEIRFESAGKRYFGRIEQHYHPPGGPLKPWGYHAGVSLFVEVAVAADDVVHDDSTLQA